MKKNNKKETPIINSFDPESKEVKNLALTSSFKSFLYFYGRFHDKDDLIRIYHEIRRESIFGTKIPLNFNQVSNFENDIEEYENEVTPEPVSIKKEKIPNKKKTKNKKINDDNPFWG